jgi:hypothetical protein
VEFFKNTSAICPICVRHFSGKGGLSNMKRHLKTCTLEISKGPFLVEKCKPALPAPKSKSAKLARDQKKKMAVERSPKIFAVTG